VKKIKYTDDNFLKELKRLKLGARFIIESNGERVFGIECIKALDSEYIFIGLFEEPDEKELFTKPYLQGGTDVEEDIEAEIMEYIDEIIDYLDDSFNIGNANIILE